MVATQRAPVGAKQVVVAATYACFTFLAAAVPVDRAAAQSLRLDIAEAIETSRFVEDSARRAIFLSPDRSRYAVLLLRGDLQSDSVVVEISIGGLDSLTHARPHRIAQLQTTGLGSDENGARDVADLLEPGRNPPIWFDDHTIAMLWPDNHDVIQIVTVDATTGRPQYVSNHETDVRTFAPIPGGGLVFGARTPAHRDVSDALWQSGFSITAPDALSILNGYADPTGFLDRSGNISFFVVGPDGQTHPVSADTTTVLKGEIFLSPVVSPNGRWAVVELTPPSLSPDWSNYSIEVVQSLLLEWSRNPHGLLARNLRRLALIDLQTASARWLLDVPSTFGAPASLAWSSDSRYVFATSLVPPPSMQTSQQFVPLAALDVATGSVEDISNGLAEGLEFSELAATPDGGVQTADISGHLYRFARGVVGWELATPLEAARDPVEIQQSLNEPPALYWIETGGARRLLLDPTPQLRRGSHLGRAEFIRWTDDSGERSGVLYYPDNFRRGQRYPLVIQTHGAAADTFTLYGPEYFPPAGPGWAGYFARPLAANGYFVLNVNSTEGSANSETIERIVSGYESGARHLVGAGFVDCSRVGLIGFSSTGWRVEYAVSHSTFPYAAAVAVDNKDGGYIQAALSDWPVGLSEDLNGAAPFGADGIEAWTHHSPALNVEHVTTPLLLVTTDNYAGLATPVANHWEMFSRLRRINRPVELYVAPNLRRGAHTLQNPGQVLAVQERVAQWWDFWLRDRDDSPLASSASAQANDRGRLRLQQDAIRSRSQVNPTTCSTN